MTFLLNIFAKVRTDTFGESKCLIAFPTLLRRSIRVKLFRLFDLSRSGDFFSTLKSE